MENFSNNRGRPRTILPLLADAYKETWSDLTTDRSINNRYHMIHALGVLGAGDEERYRYLTGSADAPRMRMTILTALGRLGDVDTIREVAAYICRDRMTTGDALNFIKIVRQQSPLPEQG